MSEVTYKFADLDEKVKDKVRDRVRYDDVEWDWWDAVYEDAVDMAKLLGITISTTTRKTANGKPVHNINIWFRGFSSQGDGAAFDGSYEFVSDAVARVVAETGGNDPELLRIAQELTLMQLTQRLNGREPFQGGVSSKRDCCIEASIYMWGEDEIGEPDEEQFTDLMQAFADWIFNRLEDEYDHLTSDEYIDERLNDSEDEYDEDGCMV